MLPLLLVAAAMPSNQPVRVDGILCHPRHLLVKLTDINQTASLHKAGVRVLETYPQIGWAVVEAEPKALRATRTKLELAAGVERVEYDGASRPAYTPNDDMWDEMWHAKTIKADLAWDLGRGQPNVIVAVIDTGVNHHPDLDANIWTNPGETAGNGVDDDGNGYVDDIRGYDFGYGDGDPNDEHGHGTACSGLVAAVQDNTIGVTGVAPFAKIMCLKASIDSGYFYDSANIGAYLYAQAMGAKVLSCSFYSDRVSQAERDAIDYVWNHGVLPVVAAGNAASVVPFYPGAYENVLGVAATEEGNNRAGFSNYGSWVDVASPGVNLRTTTAGGGYTQGFGGTSGATPQVAGLAALIWGEVPSLTNAQVRSIIEDTATTLTWDFSNYGLVNCEQALKVAMGLAAQVQKPTLVRYVTPVVAGQPIGRAGRATKVARVYGRGFQVPNVIRVEIGGLPAQVVGQSRDWVDFNMPSRTGVLNIFVNNVLKKSITRPTLPSTMWSLIEVSSPGATTTGGFDEGLSGDGVYVTCTRRGDGLIRLEGTFRRCSSFGNPFKLVLRRHYTGSTVGTEKVFLYDWSSASYPYGSFTLVNAMPLPQATTQTAISIAEPWRYIDPEGTMYLRIETSADVPEACKLWLDMAQMRDR